MILAAPAKAKDFKVKDFRAKGDGRTLDTKAINRAIAAAAAAGGGTVTFGKGRYLTGSIHLKSHVAPDIQVQVRSGKIHSVLGSKGQNTLRLLNSYGRSRYKPVRPLPDEGKWTDNGQDFET